MIREAAHLITALSIGSSLLQAKPLQEGIATFRDAYRAWDTAKFWNASRDLRKSALAHPKSAAAHAWLGTAHFHRMLQIHSRPMTPHLSAAAASDREAAIDAMEKAVQLDVRQAEAHAILSTLYGMKIEGIMSGIRYGSRVQKHMKLAQQHGANNPRVQYLLGAGRMRTAEKQDQRFEALKSLLLAEALYEAEAMHHRKAHEPAWGRDACLAFIGEAFSQLHKPDKARDYYRKSLIERPNNRMAKEGLLRLK